MDTYNVYLIKFFPEPIENHHSVGLKTIAEAENYIKNPKGNVVGDLWVIVKVPRTGNKYELIKSIVNNH